MNSYSRLKELMTGILIEPPTEITSDQLVWWLNGYIHAIDKVKSLIDEINDTGNQRDY